MPSLSDPGSLFLAFLAILLGGVLKGATGAGSPVVAVPILSLLYSVPYAVTVFVLPNLLTNLWQGWQYRKSVSRPRFVATFALTGGLGAIGGSYMLAYLPAEILMLVVALVVLAYIAFRLARPDWRLSFDWGHRLAAPLGVVGGMMQGAGGISAPVSVTFLNALRLKRAEFIATISVFFAMMATVQVPTLWYLGLLGAQEFVQSLVATAVLFLGMPAGEWLARRFSERTFDRAMLILLAVIAVRLIWAAL